MFSCLKSIILICLLAISISSLGQTALSLKISTLSFNFIENKYPDKFNLQLDNNGRLSIEPSIIIGYERFFSDLPLSIRFSQGLGIDVAGKLSGLTQCKLHLSVFRQWKSAINVSIGASLQYRNKWDIETGNDVLGYSEFVGNMEFNNYILTAAIEYNYSLNKNSDFSISLNHYDKYKVYLMGGLRLWISKDKKRKYKCLTCPDF